MPFSATAAACAKQLPVDEASTKGVQARDGGVLRAPARERPAMFSSSGLGEKVDSFVSGWKRKLSLASARAARFR